MAKCKECEAEIVWGMTAAGKRMPLNAETQTVGGGETGTLGKWLLFNGEARLATAEDLRLRRPLRVPHWATCPAAASFRKQLPGVG